MSNSMILDSVRLSQLNPSSAWGDPALIVQWAMFRAIIDKASDIHIDSFKNEVRIRLEIDGLLHTVFSGPFELWERFSVVIKNAANMNIADERMPEDGRIRVSIRGREVDFRVCAIPNVQEKQDFTLRVIDKSNSLMDLEDLGLEEEHLHLLHEALKLPHGLILANGPTGCGKTTLLYAMLKALNRPLKKVQTIEDPVEYRMDGVCQAQVETEWNLTFPLLLRSILRAAPDIIMVGEIRDPETAQVALSAAGSGHLVLSTMHTNDALSAINRLIDFGVPRYLVADAVNLTIAQRLVRLLCSKCKKERPMTESERALFEANGIALPPEPPALFDPVGCEACRDIGFKGRTVVMEAAVMDKRLKEMIASGTRIVDLPNATEGGSFVNLYQYGLIKVLKGLTTLEEISALRSVFRELVLV